MSRRNGLDPQICKYAVPKWVGCKASTLSVHCGCELGSPWITWVMWADLLPSPGFKAYLWAKWEWEMSQPSVHSFLRPTPPLHNKYFVLSSYYFKWSSDTIKWIYTHWKKSTSCPYWRNKSKVICSKMICILILGYKYNTRWNKAAMCLPLCTGLFYEWLKYCKCIAVVT